MCSSADAARAVWLDEREIGAVAHEQLFAAVKRLRRNVSKVHCEVRGKVLAIQLHHHAERLRLHVARQQAMGYKGEERERETERERERQRERESERKKESERVRKRNREREREREKHL